MKWLAIIMLALLLCGCSTIHIRDDHPNYVDVRVWVIEDAPEKPMVEPTPTALFVAVSKKAARIVFERHVGVVPGKEMKLAEVDEVNYPTQCALSQSLSLAPSEFLCTNIGTTVFLTMRRIPTLKACSVDISCDLGSLLGNEEHAVATTTNDPYTQFVPRFLTQTLSAVGILEPGMVHLIGSARSPAGDSRRRSVLIQYEVKE